MNTEAIYTKLYLVSKKIRGQAYLIENLGHAESQPDNKEETMWGIGLVLEGLANEVYEVAETIEKE